MSVSTVLLGTFTGGPGGGMDEEGPPSESEGLYTVQFDSASGEFVPGSLRLRAEVASLKKELEARKDYPAVVAERNGLREAMAKACATSANARRADASRRLIAEGLGDFPAMFDEAICKGGSTRA